MVEMAQLAGSDAFKAYSLNPSAYAGFIDNSLGGVNFRTYIQMNKVDPANPATWYPYVGNVHPIK